MRALLRNAAVPLLWLLLSLLLAVGATAGEVEHVPFSMRVDEPEDGLQREGPTALLPVSGWAGESSIVQEGVFDIVVIIDTSWSARRGSGADVNGDGHAGGHGFALRRSFFSWLINPFASSDPDDTILRAEVAAVRRLREGMSSERNRIGIVMMRTWAGIGTRLDEPPARMDRTLHNLERARPEGRTNMAEAIRLSNQVMLEAPDDGLERERIIILLSDGQPTVPPNNENATDEAILAARESADQGIKIYAIALGLNSPGEQRAFHESARVTGGKFLPLDEPGDVIRALAEIRLTGLEDVTIENATTGKPARLKRMFPNGSFDGMVKLVEGENRLVIRATSVDGEELSEERVVTWHLKWPHNPRDRWFARKQVEEIQQKLRDVKVETDLQDEMRRMRERLDRELQVEVDPNAPPED
jgi:hypothetical protein